MRPVAPYCQLLHEKRVYTIKISVGDSLYHALQDLAAGRDRSLSDYCQHRLTLDTFGELMAMQTREPAESLAHTDRD